MGIKSQQSTPSPNKPGFVLSTANASIYIAYMLQALRAWLNGTRDYSLGVALYNKLGDNNDLKRLLLKGKTDFCNKRLQAELLTICNKLKRELYENDQPDESEEGAEITIEPTQKSTPKAISTPAIENANPDLYAACKLEANKVYKEAMNTRAVLFHMVPSELYEDPNRPDLVEQRSKLSVKVVELYNEASRLYDRADHVRVHGILPGEKADTSDNSPLGDGGDIPDHLVKSKLDNLRKNYNKIKAREQTPERITLLQKHQADIFKLETRWLYLKPTK